jgi:hypothetical protein
MAKAVEEGAGVRVTHLLTDSGPFSADSAFGRRVAAADKDASALLLLLLLLQAIKNDHLGQAHRNLLPVLCCLQTASSPSASSGTCLWPR